MLIPETSLIYCGIFVLLYFVLTANVGRWRGKEKRSLGFNQDENSMLFRAVRAHGNFGEFIPFIALLLVLDEVSGRSATGIHIMGSLLVLARISHAYGILLSPGVNKFRIAGAGITMLTMMFLGVTLIVKGIT